MYCQYTKFQVMKSLSHLSRKFVLVSIALLDSGLASFNFFLVNDGSDKPSEPWRILYILYVWVKSKDFPFWGLLVVGKWGIGFSECFGAYAAPSSMLWSNKNVSLITHSWGVGCRRGDFTPISHFGGTTPGEFTPSVRQPYFFEKSDSHRFHALACRTCKSGALKAKPVPAPAKISPKTQIAGLLYLLL